MKTVVITGSTRGIGLGLAANFLARGCQVVISGRSQASIDAAIAELTIPQDRARIAGVACDVTDYAQVQSLWDAACARFGSVDIWINNAGIANTLTPFWELSPEQMRAVVETNMLGAMYGSKVAILNMLQQGHGNLYNMEGFGSRGGRKLAGLTLYGTTKAGLAFLDDSLMLELKDKPVHIGTLSPGMVVTDLLLNQRSGDAADWERSKRAFNILADKVETVTPWLVDQILANQQSGAHITWLTQKKVLLRFLSAPFNKRNVID